MLRNNEMDLYGDKLLKTNNYLFYRLVHQYLHEQITHSKNVYLLWMAIEFPFHYYLHAAEFL